jgi:hypothetical protein
MFTNYVFDCLLLHIINCVDFDFVELRKAPVLLLPHCLPAARLDKNQLHSLGTGSVIGFQQNTNTARIKADIDIKFYTDKKFTDGRSTSEIMQRKEEK